MTNETARAWMERNYSSIWNKNTQRATALRLAANALEDIDELQKRFDQVMTIIDSFLTEAELDHSEVKRAEIMKKKIIKMLAFLSKEYQKPRKIK